MRLLLTLLFFVGVNARCQQPFPLISNMAVPLLSKRLLLLSLTKKRLHIPLQHNLLCWFEHSWLHASVTTHIDLTSLLLRHGFGPIRTRTHEHTMTPTSGIQSCHRYCDQFLSSLDEGGGGLYAADFPALHGYFPGNLSLVQATYRTEDFLAASCKVECVYQDGLCLDYDLVCSDTDMCRQYQRMCRYANAIASGNTEELAYDCHEEDTFWTHAFQCDARIQSLFQNN